MDTHPESPNETMLGAPTKSESLTASELRFDFPRMTVHQAVQLTNVLSDFLQLANGLGYDRPPSGFNPSQHAAYIAGRADIEARIARIFHFALPR